MKKNNILSVIYIFLGIFFYALSIYVLLNFSPSRQEIEGNIKIVNYIQTINLDLSTLKIQSNKHFELVLFSFLFGTVFFITGNIGLFFKRKGSVSN